MLTIRTQRHIRLVTVEKPTAWIVYAILLETRGTETTQIGKPKVVKVLPKETVAPALSGSVQTVEEASEAVHSKVFLLDAPQKFATEYTSAIPSPYVSSFSKENLDFVLWFSARPPTFSF